MRLTAVVAVALWVALAGSHAAAQYGPGGYGGGYSPPAPPRPPAPYRPSPYRQPGYRPPPSPPAVPRTNQYLPSTPQTQYVYEEYKYCTSCKKKVADSAAVGQRCPHCGIYWATDDRGGRASSALNPFAALAGLIAIAVVVVIGVIAWIVIRIVSSQSTGHPQQDLSDDLLQVLPGDEAHAGTRGGSAGSM